MAILNFVVFLCEWHIVNRKNHIKKEWPEIESFMPGNKNFIIQSPLVNLDKVIVRLLHIKLRLFKNFVKAMDKNGV